MPGMIPPTLPSSAASNGKSYFGLSRPQAKTSIFGDEYKKASVSMYRAQHEQDPAVSSVSRIGQQGGQQASTSISHGQHDGARTSIYGDAQMNEQRDQQRYQYIRRLIREKQEQDSGLAIGKGGTTSKRIIGKKLRSLVNKNKSTYRNISVADRKVLEGIVEKGAKHKSTGSSFSEYDKRKMRAAARKAQRSGQISSADRKDFSKIIDNLK